MTKTTKIKNWVINHVDVVVATASTAVVFVVGVWAYRASIDIARDNQKIEREYKQAIAEAAMRGDMVLPDGESGVWIISRNK